MDSGLVRFIDRGIRFAASKIDSTHVGVSIARKPVTSFELLLPLALPPSPQSLIVESTGQIVYGPVSVKIQRFEFTNANLIAGRLSFTHEIGEKYNIIQIFDEDDKLIAAVDDLICTSESVLTIDLTSFGILRGTWHLAVMG